MLRVINHQEMQIKTTVGYHLTTVLNGCYQKGHEINVGEDMEKMYPSMLLVGMLTDAATMENSMEVPPKKNKIESSHDPIIPLLGIHPKKMKILKDICTPMFIAVLFTIAKIWK